MATATLEERLTAVEAELAELKARQWSPLPERKGVTGRTAPDFLDRFVGIYENDEMAERMFRAVEAEREKERVEARKAREEDND